MEHSNPHKTSIKQQIPDTDSNADRETTNIEKSTTIPQEQKQQGDNDRHQTYERTNNRILAGILIVTFIYAVFSGLQWNIMRSSMELDQRAWIGIDSMAAYGEHGKPTKIEIKFTNTGRPPLKM